MQAARRVAVPTQKGTLVIQGLERQRSGGIHPSCNRYLRKVKIAAWENPSTLFRDRRDDRSVGGVIQPHRSTCVIPFIHTGSIRNAVGTASALFWVFTPKAQICNRTGEIVFVSLAFCQCLCYAVTGATSTPAGGSPGLFRG